nr:iron-sulfur cluster assembly accessory protein [Nannocystis sp.]
MHAHAMSSSTMSSSTKSSESSAAAASATAPSVAASLVVTSRAAKVMREQLARRGTPQAAIRLGIRGGGCTGYSYLFEFEDREPRASDHVLVKDGVRVVVDPKSMLLLKGTEVDFETGMRGHGFKFTNPNTQGSCGCGESITF